MNCRTARTQIHAQLDGTLADREPLQEHLDGCPACRQTMEEMARLCGAAANCAPPPDEEVRLQRLTAGVLRAIEAPREARAARGLWMPVVALAGMLLAFCLGYNLAPRSGPSASAAPAMQQVQAPAEPRVIVRERVVTREVPVYRERVVYRDRVVRRVLRAPAVPTSVEWSEAEEPVAEDTEQIADAPQTADVALAAEAELSTAAGTPPTPGVEKDDTPAIVVSLPASEGLPMATYSQSRRLARLTTDVAGE